MRYALVALAPLTTISTDSLASEIAPLYAAAVVIFAAVRMISAMFRRNQGLLVFHLNAK